MAARKIPQLDDTLNSAHQGAGGFFGKIGHFFDSLPWNKVDFFVSQFLEKLLRRVRVFVMRVDNRLIHHLGKIKTLKDAHLQSREKKLGLFENNNGNGEAKREENSNGDGEAVE